MSHEKTKSSLPISQVQPADLTRNQLVLTIIFLILFALAVFAGPLGLDDYLPFLKAH